MREVFKGPVAVDKYADLHMHTSGSDGLMEPAQLLETALASGRIHTIAGTDHESIEPSVRLKNESERRSYPLEVVVGTELTTNAGHIVALYLNDNIPSGRSPEWTIAQIHKQGGLAIAAHPLYPWTRSLGKITVLRVVNNPDPEIYFDGFEVFNAGVHDNPHTKPDKALLFYVAFQEEMPQSAWKLGAAVGCTDGHFYTVGRGLTGYAGDLRSVIKERTTTVFTLDEREQLQLWEFVRQQYSSMVLENGRRIRRYAERRLREMNEGK